MSRRLGWALLVLLAPAAARAAEAPERLLSAGTQVYLRWDGVQAHRAAFDKTALGKIMQGDAGRFLDKLVADIKGNLGTWLTVPQLLAGATPDKLQQLQADVVEAPRLLDTVLQHGFVFAAEARLALPPAGQVTLILPQAGVDPKPFLSVMRLITSAAEIPIEERKVEGRAVFSIKEEDGIPVRIFWWVEGGDAVIVLSTERPDAVVKTMLATGSRLAENALFQRVEGFKEFETSFRAYVDMGGLLKLARVFGPNVGRFIDDVGLSGLKSLTIYSGFEGDAERSLLLLEMSGPRQGLLKLADAKPFQFSDLPPMPSDLTGFYAARFDLGTAYDVGIKVIEGIIRLVDEPALGDFQEGITKINQVLGFDLRKDLLGALGDLVVLYNSPAEGPLAFGHTLLIPVKDEKKVVTMLTQMAKTLGSAAGATLEVKKKPYRDTEIYEVVVEEQGFVFLPAFAVHKGWLAISVYPQGVQGYIQRANSELPRWKPDERTQTAMKKAPAELVSLVVDDPRPATTQLLALAPLLIRAINSFSKSSFVDVGSLPNAQAVTQHLFPNVATGSVQGDTLRLESRSSLAIPFELSGVDSYVLFSVLFLLALRF